jgi:uncharacterized membrane protein
MDYLTVKWLHVLSSTILFGAGIGSAFHLVLSALARNTRGVAVVTRHVVTADWVFTATTVLFQPLSGFWLMHLAGMPPSTPWIAASLWLYAFAIACWLPVVWIQLKMRDVSASAAASGGPLPRAWWRYFTWWVVLGFAAFFAFIAIFHLMVVKRLPLAGG